MKLPPAFYLAATIIGTLMTLLVVFTMLYHHKATLFGVGCLVYEVTYTVYALSVYLAMRRAAAASVENLPFVA